MKGKDLMIVAGAAVAVLLLMRYAGGTKPQPQRYWVSNEGNTGYPAEAVPVTRGVSI